MPSIELDPVGIVRTVHDDPRRTPIQASLNPEEVGTVELDAKYADALDGLDGFSHVWLLTWLDARGTEPIEGPDLRQTPFLLGAATARYGIFATRGPRRPNRLGLHLVRLVSVSHTPPVVTFAGVDLLDGTPVLDVKPWVARFDTPFGAPARSGWFDDVEMLEGVTPATLRDGTPPGAAPSG